MQPIPVGPSTIAGFLSTILAGALAVVAFVAGDHSEQTLGVIVGGALAAISLVTTLLGRYAQARAAIRSGAGWVSRVSDAVIDQMDNPDLPSDPDAPDPESVPTVRPHGDLNG